MTGICLKALSEAPTLYFYGELEPEASAAFARHAQSCEACAGALADLALLRSTLAPRGNARKSGEEWAGFMTRLERALDRAELRAIPGSKALKGYQQVSGGVTGLSVWLPLAAALILAIGLALMWQRLALDADPLIGTRAAARPAEVSGEIPLSVAATRHFDRAKLVVLGLAMKDPGGAEAGDWTHERALAAELLPQTRLYRLSALDRGETALADLLGDLETVLLDASMTSDADRSSLERLQRGIRRRDLLVRMDLQENTVRGL